MNGITVTPANKNSPFAGLALVRAGLDESNSNSWRTAICELNSQKLKGLLHLPKGRGPACNRLRTEPLHVSDGVDIDAGKARDGELIEPR